MEPLMAALGGQGGAPAGPAAAGPPDDTQGGGEQFSSSLDALDAAEEALHAFIQLDTDEPDRALASQALQIVLKLKAANQQSSQSGDMKSLMRSLASGGPQGGPVG